MMRADDEFQHLLLVPSFYGAATWLGWLVLYWARLVPLNETVWLSNALFLLTAVAYLSSAVLLSPYFRQAATPRVGGQPSTGALARSALLALHLVGFLGILKYLADAAAAAGGIEALALLIVTAPQEIRGENATTASLGTQVSYAGWLAVAATVLWVRQRRLSRWWLALGLAQFLGNLLFIDRTRPFWLTFTALCVLAPGFKGITVRRLSIALGGAALAGIGLFVGLGIWAGRIASDSEVGNTLLPPALQNVYAYGAGAFAYFNQVVSTETEFGYLPVRIAYPAVKALAALGLVAQPPGQVLDFLFVPFETNVGTILEPFYRDGGLLFTLPGILLFTVGIDLLALYFWRAGGLLASFAAANLCFTSFIAFFVPKVAAFPVWLFCALGLAAAHRHWAGASIGRRDGVEESPGT